MVEKGGPSAFLPGRCDPDQRLQAQGVDTVLITGTVANVCCESTARDASNLAYRVIMVADGNAAVRVCGPERNLAHVLPQRRRCRTNA